MLSDGSIIQITKYSTCKRTFIYNVTDENGNVVTDEEGNIMQAEGVGHFCFDLTVDTNGNKGPNQIGMDVFGIFVDPDGPEKEHAEICGIFCQMKKLMLFNILPEHLLNNCTM